ncbi:MAG: CBU_1079 family Dot/Icm type IV secretion system effector [Chlamydiales bacterium]
MHLKSLRKISTALLVVLLLVSGCVFHSDGDYQDIHYEDVLKFWFGPLESPEDFPKERLSLWYFGGEDIDQEMRERYSEWVEWAATGKLDHWNKTPRGRLALIILLDQLPRHMYRDTPQAYQYDPTARKILFEGLAKGDDKALFPVEKMFFYVPLQHAENLDLQIFSVALYEQLKKNAPQALEDEMETAYEKALQQKETIEKFGRFPHRNSTLNRESTVKEQQYFQKHQSTLIQE